jgi:hypothetical protein
MLGVPLVTRDAADVASLTSGFRSAVVALLLAGYTMAAGRYLGVAIHADAAEAGRVEPRLGGEWDVLALERDVLRRSRWIGFAGIALWIVVDRTQALLYTSSAAGHPLEDAWSYLCMPLLSFLLVRAAYQSMFGVRSGGDPAPARSEIDLLDLRSSYAEGRIGLRLALVWLVGSGIASLFFLSDRQQGFVISLLLISAAIALLALTLPVRRVQSAIAQAKRAELDRIEPELRAARDRVVGGKEDLSGRLADLLAYHTYVEGLREWPFDNGTVVRFALYLLIPLGSWLGGALVERVVSSVLD